MDFATGEPVGFATVSVTDSLAGGKVLAYAQTDANGVAKLNSLPDGRYSVKAEIMGYAAKSINVMLPRAEILGIRMKQSTETLDAAEVSAAGNEVVIKKDTIEYNPGAYLTTENDQLEELLKKLPGVDVDESGKITVNGETVSKITIDGKTFFLNDPKLATKNIPAKMVKKIKVIEKKSEQAEFTGIDDGERETVIDLSLDDENLGRGIFGKVMAGAGYDLQSSGDQDGRWQSSAFIGQFTRKRQLSGVLNANNTNNRAATNLSGKSSDSSDGNGISTSYMAGANGVWNLFSGDMSAGGNYVFDADRNLNQRSTERTTYLQKKQLLYSSDVTNTDNTYGHRLGGKLEHKFSPGTSVIFEPQFRFGTGNSTENTVFSTLSQEQDSERKTNEGYRTNAGKSKNWAADGYALLRHRLGIPGRTLSFNLKYNFSESSTDGMNVSLTTTFRKNGTQKDSLIDQTYRRHSARAGLSGRLSYTEPIGAGFYVEGNYTYSWSRSTSYKKSYDSDGTYNARYSNDIENISSNHRVGLNVRYQHEKTKVQAGLAVVPVHTHNETVRKGKPFSLNTNVVNYSPQFSFMMDPSEKVSVRLSYFGNSRQPSSTQLIPAPDISNPLNISMGNPYLLPTFENSLNSSLRLSDRKKFYSLNARLKFGYTMRPIVNALWYDTGGVQYTMPVNGPLSWNANTTVTYNTRIAKSNFSVYNYFYASYNTHASYVGSSGINLTSYYVSKEFDFEKFHEDYKDLTSSADFTENRIWNMGITERLRLTYRAKNLEVQSGIRGRVNKSWYTIVKKKNTAAMWNNAATLSLTYNWRSTGISMDTQYDYRWYAGYTTPHDDEHIWNVRISKLLFNKKMTLALQGYDLLEQAKALSVSDSSNQHREVYSKTLGRYVICSLTWRFQHRR